jgi:protein TonB
MFGNLVESGSHKGDNARKGSFFIGTLAVYALAFLAIGVGSIYAYNTQVENQDLKLVSLVAPTETVEVQRPQRRDTPRPAAGSSNGSNIPVFRTPPLVTRMDPQLDPPKISVAPPVPEVSEGTIYRVGIPTSGDNKFGVSGDNSGDGNRSGNSTSDSNGIDKLVKETPPPMKIEPSKPPTPKIVRSPGPVNGKATYLPKPVYTAIAKAGRASGTVIVEVLIDENGKVISAHPVSGHPLLLKEAVQAAWQARFSPTTLGDQRVKVSGIITYNFVLQ